MAIWIANDEIAGAPGVRGQRISDRDVVADACAVKGVDVAHIDIAAGEGGHRRRGRQNQGQSDVVAPQQGELVPHRRKSLEPKMSPVEPHRPADVPYTKRHLNAVKDDGLVHEAHCSTLHQPGPVDRPPAWCAEDRQHSLNSLVCNLFVLARVWSRGEHFPAEVVSEADAYTSGSLGRTRALGSL